MAGDFHSLIADVAENEMALTGHEWKVSPSVKNAMYTESVRRIQIWTFEHLAGTAKDLTMATLFSDLAAGVRAVPDIDLWLGEPGATGT